MKRMKRLPALLCITCFYFLCFITSNTRANTGFTGGSALAGMPVRAVAVAADGSVYAAIGSTSGQLYRSNDGGSSFTEVAELPDAINAIACHPEDAGTIVLAHNGGLSFSNNSGDSWNFCSIASEDIEMNADAAQTVSFDDNGYLIAVYGDHSYSAVSIHDVSRLRPLSMDGIAAGHYLAERNASLQAQDQVDEAPIQEEIIAGIVVCPNPAHGVFDVNMTLGKSADVSIKLNTMSGLTVKNYGVFPRPAGTGKITLDLTCVVPGNYLVVLEISGTVVTKKLSVY